MEDENYIFKFKQKRRKFYMPPIPCPHCGINFMRTIMNPEQKQLCNNCLVKEQIRKPKEEGKLETIDILIKCPKHIHAEIEEFCMNRGTNYTQVFLMFYDNYITRLRAMTNKLADEIEEDEDISLAQKANEVLDRIESGEEKTISHEPKKRGRPKK